MAIVFTSVAVAVTTLEVAAIATAVMEVGIAMTVVGTITKSKELTKIGGVLAMAGGVASLAIGVTGAIGGAAAAGEAGVAEGAAAGAYSDVAGEKFAQAAAENAAGAVNASGLEAAASGVRTFGIPDPSAGITDTLSGKIGETFASPISKGFEAKLPALPGAVEAPTLAPQAAAPSITGTANVEPSAWNQPGVAEGATAAPYSDVAGEKFAFNNIPKPGMFQDIKEWYKGLTPDAQSRIGTALIQGGGMALAGLSNGWTEEQKLALEREKFNLTKEQSDLKTANANYVPTVAFKPVKPTGLIAGAQGVK